MNSEVLEDPLLGPYLNAVLGKKAFDVRVLEVRKMTSIADYFIICSARSSRQVAAIADHVQQEMREQRKRPLGVEGTMENHWVLLDYGNIIIHIFFEPVRLTYNLDGLWRDAPCVRIPDPTSDSKNRETGDDTDDAE